jgi:hypothetical protein
LNRRHPHFQCDAHLQSEQGNDRNSNDLPSQPDQQETTRAPECAPLIVADWLEACPVELPATTKARIRCLIENISA